MENEKKLYLSQSRLFLYVAAKYETDHCRILLLKDLQKVEKSSSKRHLRNRLEGLRHVCPLKHEVYAYDEKTKNGFR